VDKRSANKRWKRGEERAATSFVRGQRRRWRNGTRKREAERLGGRWRSGGEGAATLIRRARTGGARISKIRILIKGENKELGSGDSRRRGVRPSGTRLRRCRGESPARGQGVEALRHQCPVVGGSGPGAESSRGAPREDGPALPTEKSAPSRDHLLAAAAWRPERRRGIARGPPARENPYCVPAVRAVAPATLRLSPTNNTVSV
jgi:hypothetical protein